MSASSLLALRLPGALRRLQRSRRLEVALVATALVALVVALTAASLRWPGHLPWVCYAPVVVLAALVLPPRWVLAVDAATALCLLYAAPRTPQAPLAASLVALLVVAGLMLWQGTSRAALDVRGTLGESLLVDLRDRLRAHGELPDIPEPWHAEVSLRSAYGQSFSGDFLVAGRSSCGSRLDLAVVDVSGKGVGAGTRALLLSGALGGLLAAVPPEQFLPVANAYLLSQDWPEGFATAIHVAIELTSGRYTLSRAGHPPGVHYSAGTGAWGLLDRRGGPVLGVLPDADFPVERGRLGRGDALVLYTDGVVEARGRDLTVGIDRMLGTAQRLVGEGFTGGAARLSSVAPAGETDDRAVLLVWRD